MHPEGGRGRLESGRTPNASGIHQPFGHAPALLAAPLPPPLGLLAQPYWPRAASRSQLGRVCRHCTV